MIGVDDAICTAAANRIEQSGTAVFRISKSNKTPADFGFNGTSLIDEEGSELIYLETIGALRGSHNGQNAAAACAACQALGLSIDEIAAGFETFPGLAHRMEQVGYVDGVLFVNDSKATNAEAAAPALSSFQKVHWIAGGLAKDGGIEALEPHFDHIEKAYFIGEAAGNFASQLNDTIPYEIAGTLQQAVNHAALDAAGLVDARLAKQNLDTTINDAPLVVGLGPGFTAGVDCHAVIETMRGVRKLAGLTQMKYDRAPRNA